MIYGVKSLRERLAAANLAGTTGTLKERIEALRKDSAYGASNSEQCEECSDDDESTSEQQSARPRERRTTHEERRKQLMADRKLVSALQPKHSCNCSFIDSTGARRECSWCLYGDGMFRDQLDKLSVGRGGFLMKTSSERREAAYDHMRLSAESGGGKQRRRIEWTIHGRLVCRAVFLERFPLSKSTLRRLERRVIAGIGPHGAGAPTERTTTEKRLQVIAWWLGYANATSERLPDVPHLYTPCRLKTEIYEEYRADLRAANRASLIVHPATFSSIYRNASELDHITISKGKRNFTRCSTCQQLEAELQSALKSHDAAAVEKVKASRLAHHSRMRADRLAYYARREEARKTGNVLCMIIDKM